VNFYSGDFLFLKPNLLQMKLIGFYMVRGDECF